MNCEMSSIYPIDLLFKIQTPINDTMYAGDAFAVQYNSFTADFRVIMRSSYSLHTLLVPFGKPVKSPHKNKYIVGLIFVADKIDTKNSERTKNGKSDGITEP